MMSKHVTTTKGLSHFMLFLLRLLALALEHGGADNVSFVLCRVAEDAAP